MTDFRADLGALEGLLAGLAAFGRRAASLEAEVDAEASRLHGVWTGTAASEHAAAHRRWLDGEERMRSAALKLRAVVAAAHSNYAGAAGANVRMWT